MVLSVQVVLYETIVLKVNLEVQSLLIVLVFILKLQVNMNKDRIKLDNPPSTIVLSDDILYETYSDIQADQAIMLEQSGIYE